MIALALLFSLLPVGDARASEGELTTVPRLDIPRYMGRWHEIAKYPNRFQKGCDGATADYTLRDDGDVTVVNRCIGPDGAVRQVRGKAWVTDRATNAKLKVRFFWPFSGKYWVIDLGGDYEFAVVSEPKRRYLWILSRTPSLPPDVLRGILDRLEGRGFDVGKLVFSKRP